MSKRNSHQALYRGPAKPIPTQTWRSKLTDIASVSDEFLWSTMCLLGLGVVALDLFYWRVLP